MPDPSSHAPIRLATHGFLGYPNPDVLFHPLGLGRAARCLRRRSGRRHKRPAPNRCASISSRSSTRWQNSTSSLPCGRPGEDDASVVGDGLRQLSPPEHGVPHAESTITSSLELVRVPVRGEGTR